MDRRITIQKNTPTANEYGEMIESWVDFREVWATVRRQYGREIFSAGKVGEVDAVFGIWFISGLNEKEYRVVFEENTYDIASVIETGYREGMEIVAKAQR